MLKELMRQALNIDSSLYAPSYPWKTYFCPKTLRQLESFFYVIRPTLCKKYPYSELFWSVFSHILTEYGHFSRSINDIIGFEVEKYWDTDLN